MNHHGIHHVTAIAGPARRNLAFHAGVLGQRLVKRTVNFDDPGTWHLYYGDVAGNPGTVLTFFPWEHVAPGQCGAGEAAETAFRVPEAALDWWRRRLEAHGTPVGEREERFGAPVLPFRDPDGMRLALVGVRGAGAEPAWAAGDVPAEHALRGFHGVTLLLADPARTAAVLADVMGFTDETRESGRTRLAVPDGGLGGTVDLVTAPSAARGRQGGGSVHHVAFRAADDAAQATMVGKLVRDHRLGVTEQKDRNYFRSVYLREPGGVIFEIATDVPGFAVDEAADSLGTALKLPAELEPHREHIAAGLPALA